MAYGKLFFMIVYSFTAMNRGHTGLDRECDIMSYFKDFTIL
jgi:hypothetical protein